MDSRGIHRKFHSSHFGRTVSAACGAATLAIVATAGCGSHTQVAGASHHPAASKAHAGSPAAQALRLAAEQEQHLTSFTATFTMRLSGRGAAAITGAVRARLKPDLAMNMEATLARPGRAPRSVREILTQHTLYFNGGQMFTQRYGKPWVEVPAGSLHRPPGLNFGPVDLFGPRLGKTGTASSGQNTMLAAAKHVRMAGSQMVGGVQTTRYSGIYQLPLGQTGIHGMKPWLERRLVRDLGLGRIRLSAWIDSRHQLRKLSFSENLGPERMTGTVTYTGLAEPVTVLPPPPGQVAAIPPGMASGTLS